MRNIKIILPLVIAGACLGLALGTNAATLAERLGGYILLQVEENGEAWYVEPDRDDRFYMGRPSDAFDLMRAFGLGIAHDELMDYIVGRFPARLAGKILLDVEWNGEAYYVYPDDLRGYYLGRPADAFQVMRDLGLGIANRDLTQIALGAGSGTPPEDESAETDLPLAGVGDNYHLVDTQQSHCFDDTSAVTCPAEGDFFGQDAQYAGRQPSYTDNGDGTVTDNVTGLMWQQAHNEERLSYEDATLTCDWSLLAGYHDWRMPTIKELYSLTDWRGLTGETDFIDGTYFDLEWPDESILADDPFASTHWPGMMGQTWSSTIYKGQLWDRADEAAFFMNFLDGRIKSSNTDRSELFYRCVRGPRYGVNDLRDNGDGTVSDLATGLTWQQSDDGQTRHWGEALAYCENLELAETDDWRLPNVKELQSIVNYDSAAPAKFAEFGQSDPAAWFWSSTSFETGAEATYVCFGECTSADGVDVHGAGAQRSDPKSGDPADLSGRGGQNDEVRVNNYVRCVRGGATLTDQTSPAETAPGYIAPIEADNPEPIPASAPPPPQAAIEACATLNANDTCYHNYTVGYCAEHPETGLFCKL